MVYKYSSMNSVKIVKAMREAEVSIFQGLFYYRLSA